MEKVNVWKAVGLLILSLSMMPSAAVAQGQGMGKGMGRGMCPACMNAQGTLGYRSAGETTVTGVIEEVQELTGRMGSTGLHLSVKVDSERLEVHLGPADFVAEQGVQLVVGDQITITGAPMGREGKVMLAREVTKGSQVLTLRDEEGKPIWFGQMKGMKKGCCKSPK